MFISYLLWQMYISLNPGMSRREGDIRLVGGSHNREGRVEIFLSETWGTISDDGVQTAAAQVACRQLGFEVHGQCAHIHMCTNTHERT